MKRILQRNILCLCDDLIDWTLKMVMFVLNISKVNRKELWSTQNECFLALSSEVSQSSWAVSFWDRQKRRSLFMQQSWFIYSFLFPKIIGQEALIWRASYLAVSPHVAAVFCKKWIMFVTQNKIKLSWTLFGLCWKHRLCFIAQAWGHQSKH